MKRAALLSTVAITAAIFGETGESGDALAQCVASTDCTSLGYTETSCPNGGLKCPFGNTWSCKQENCDASYQYTCSGTGYTGGSGTACGGKYSSCTCASGYSWSNGTCTRDVQYCTVSGIKEHIDYGCVSCTSGDDEYYAMRIVFQEGCRIGEQLYIEVYSEKLIGTYTSVEICEEECARNSQVYKEYIGECTASTKC